HAGDDVALQASNGGGTHLPDVAGVLAIGLLCPTPGRVVQQVHADAPDEVGALGPGLRTDRRADALLESRVPRRAPGHRHREAGGVTERDAARPVAEPDAGKAEPRDLAA